MPRERRKHKRFSATAFLNMPVTLTPFPPFFGQQIKGQLIDLSAGGMALVIGEMIPMGTQLNLCVTFPDRSQLDTVVTVRRTLPKGKKYLLGIEFNVVPEHIEKKINKMSADYIDCESRIRQQEANVCRPECAFFAMCSKPQKMNPVFDVDVALELAFKALDNYPTLHK